MSFFKAKFRQNDRNYSRYIRSIGYCEMCGRSNIKLEAAHFWSRKHEITRFDDDNVYCLCFTCHQKSHEDKEDFTKFVKKKLGDRGYDLLEYTHNQTKKRDDKLDKLIIKEKLKSVGLEWA